MFKGQLIYATTLVFLLSLLSGVTTFGQGTAFSYQGRLTDNGNDADGLFDMQFKLFDVFTAGAQVGGTVTNATVQVQNGVFIVQLDFSPCTSCFDGSARFLELSIRPAGSLGPYTVLRPRQPITSAPYALRALDATKLGGVAATGFIQNTTSQQTGTDFNISGSGTAGGSLTGGVINAVTHYNIGGLRMLAANGTLNNGLNNLAASNTFLGESAGLNTTPSAILSSLGGKLNSFFGAEAGKANTTGFSNSFFGVSAGLSNTTGSHNAFFGLSAGKGNTTASGNSFFGREAGVSNTTGNSNAFFGFAAGFSNDSGSFNTFLGQSAADSNVNGIKNTVIGYDADVGAASLSNATAIGANASVTQSNSLVLGGITGVNGGTSVNVGIGTTTPQHRLDVNGVVNTSTQYNLGGVRMLSVSGPYDDGVTTLAASNTFLGDGVGINTSPSPTLNNITGKFNTFFGANAGKASSLNTGNAFFGARAGEASNAGTFNCFFGYQAGQSNTGGDDNVVFGAFAGSNNTNGEGNVFIGQSAGVNNTTGSKNTFIGWNADFDALDSNSAGNTLLGTFSRVTSPGSVFGRQNATAIGYRARVDRNDSMVLGGIRDVNGCTSLVDCDSVNVGIGTTSPSATLHVVRDTSDSADPVAIFQSPGTQMPLAFSSGATEVARIRADSSGNLVFATLGGASRNIFFRAGDDSGTDMFIQSSTGNVGIGDITPVDKLDVEGDIRVGTDTTGCVKDANGTVLVGTCSSDARFKHSITSFPDTLEKLVKLRPTHFYWRAAEYKEKAFGREQSFGLIAQEVEEVMPELVTEDGQGMKAVRYSKLPLLMLQAIKELKADNDALRQQLKDQEERLKRLERAMDAIGDAKR